MTDPETSSHPEAGHVPTSDSPPQPPGKRQKVERVDLQSSHEQRGTQMSDAEIIKKLWGFVVPNDKPEFRTRVGISMAFLVASKGLNVAVSSPQPPAFSPQSLAYYLHATLREVLSLKS